MIRSSFALALVALAPSAPALAQASATGAPVVIGAADTSSLLHTGTDVELKTITELTTEGKHLRVGDRFDLEVSEPVKMNGQPVIPVGARAIGEVTAIRNKGMWGKSGSIDARVLYVILNDRQVRLAGTLNDKGKAGGVGAVAVSAVVFLPAGFFMTGTSARVPAGTQVHARTDEDVPVAFAQAAAPASPVVPAAAPAPLSAAPAATLASAPAAATVAKPAVLTTGSN